MSVQSKIKKIVVYDKNLVSFTSKVQLTYNLLTYDSHLKRTKNRTLKLGLTEVVCTGLILASTIEIKPKCPAFLF